MIDLNAPPETDDSILDDVDLEGIAASQPKPKWKEKELPTVAIVPNSDPMLIDINKVALTPPNFLIEDVVETPCTGMVFGASGSGKSFFVLDLALCCATGIPWLGKSVKEGPVVLICGEGRHGIPRRVAAWKSVHGAIPDGRFMMSQRRVEFDPETVLEMVCEINGLAAKSEPPVLIVVDTMARSLPGEADENSSRDIMNFLEICDKLQRQYNCVVLLVHHTGHAESSKNRARGSRTRRREIPTLCRLPQPGEGHPLRVISPGRVGVEVDRHFGFEKRQGFFVVRGSVTRRSTYGTLRHAVTLSTQIQKLTFVTPCHACLPFG